MINGRTGTYYLNFAYTSAFTDSLVLFGSEGTSEVLVVEVTFSYPTFL